MLPLVTDQPPNPYASVHFIYSRRKYSCREIQYEACIIPKQGLGNKMKENCETNNHEQNKIYIPPKLPNSLAKKTCSPLWKKIVQAIEDKDVETVFEFVKSIDRQQDILCLPHPFMDNIDTFPSKSVREGMCNFIFFHDKNEQYQWILCQCTSFVDAIFSETFSGKHKASTTENVILNAAKKVIRNEKKSEVRQLQQFGFHHHAEHLCFDQCFRHQ